MPVDRDEQAAAEERHHEAGRVLGELRPGQQRHPGGQPGQQGGQPGAWARRSRAGPDAFPRSSGRSGGRPEGIAGRRVQARRGAAAPGRRRPVVPSSCHTRRQRVLRAGGDRAPAVRAQPGWCGRWPVRRGSRRAPTRARRARAPSRRRRSAASGSAPGRSCSATVAEDRDEQAGVAGLLEPLQVDVRVGGLGQHRERLRAAERSRRTSRRARATGRRARRPPPSPAGR